MKWRHMESKQRREQERASAAASSAPRSSCISVPNSITCDPHQKQPVTTPSTKAISSSNNTNLVHSDISKANMPHLGIFIIIIYYSVYSLMIKTFLLPNLS